MTLPREINAANCLNPFSRRLNHADNSPSLTSPNGVSAIRINNN